MRSRGNPDDLTTRARIRDAALRLFPEQGFDATTVRQIAREAVVSPALVLHHFGSKDGLRQACDDHVVTRFRELKGGGIEGGMFDPTFMSAALEESQLMIRYLAWAFLRNHEAASELYDEMLAEAVSITRTAVERGIFVDTDDLATRTAIQFAMQLGPVLLHEHVKRTTGIDPFTKEGVASLTRPILEILSGLMNPDVRERIQGALDAEDVGATSF